MQEQLRYWKKTAFRKQSLYKYYCRTQRATTTKKAH